MPASIQFTNTTEVSVNCFKKVASVDFHIANAKGIQIYQRCEQFYANTIFHVKIINTCNKEIFNLKLADYIHTADPYSIQRVKLSKGRYHFISHGVCCHIESIAPNEVIYLSLVLSSKPRSYISHSIGLKD